MKTTTTTTPVTYSSTTTTASLPVAGNMPNTDTTPATDTATNGKVTAEDLCDLLKGPGSGRQGHVGGRKPRSLTEESDPKVDLYFNPDKVKVRSLFEKQEIQKYKELFSKLDLAKVGIKQTACTT